MRTTPSTPLSTTLETIKDLIHDKFGIEKALLLDDQPIAEFGLDSLSLVELLFSIEEHFKIDLPDNRTDLNTLTGLAGLVDDILAETAAQ